MDLISMINNKYGGNIMLRPPYAGAHDGNIPETLHSMLCHANGIMETMTIPGTMIVEWTAFHTSHYGIEGVVFADDGTGDPYILKPDGSVTCYHVIVSEEDVVANTLCDFFN